MYLNEKKKLEKLVRYAQRKESMLQFLFINLIIHYLIIINYPEMKYRFNL